VPDPLLAITWLDAVKLGAALVTPIALAARALRKIGKTMTAILEVTQRLPIVEHDVSLLKADSVRKHAENTDRLNLLDIKADAISAQVASQKSTGEFIAEVLGEPVQGIFRLLQETRLPPPREGT
jgi:hypothetical protein